MTIVPDLQFAHMIMLDCWHTKILRQFNLPMLGRQRDTSVRARRSRCARPQADPSTAAVVHRICLAKAMSVVEYGIRYTIGESRMIFTIRECLE
jgi:hypothetical protein